MMRFEYDPQFVEQATFLAARRDPEKECVLHELLDPLYRIGDGESRQRVFREGYGELFRRFGLDAILPAYVRTFPLMAERIGRCIIREAERSRSQSVDLYREKSAGSECVGEQVLIMALCPECLLDRSRLGPWLYRQLQHVEDMVDKRFAYETKLPEASTVQQNLIRDRYAVLWDVFVEGRLIRSGTIGNDAVNGLWRSFIKAFTRDAQMPSRRTFEQLLTAHDLTHTRILSWATTPDCLLTSGEGECNDRNESAGMAAVL